MRYQLSFPIVIPRYKAGYLRVTHPFATHPEEQAPPSAFYLHVLGTPPAFILSQDQTLIKIIVCLKLILSLTDLLFFYCSVTITSVIAPCTLVRLVQFSKVFVALARQLYQYITTSSPCQYLFSIFLKKVFLFLKKQKTRSGFFSFSYDYTSSLYFFCSALFAQT